MARRRRVPRRRAAASTTVLVVAGLLVAGPLHPTSGIDSVVDRGLRITAVSTGGAGASDEYVELFNASPAPVDLAGVELAYVSASGGTVSVRVAWDVTAPALVPGSHFLVANADGSYAAIADATYHGGLAAAGGTLVLRDSATGTPIDAVGWGTASGGWLEGTAAVAPPAGSSIARVALADGGVVDSGDNSSDFHIAPASPRSAVPPAASPDPTAAETPDPSPTPPSAPSSAPTVSASTSPAPTASATASPDPTAGILPIAAARSLPDGMIATVAGVALTGSAFHDGGGFVADATGGIAVIVDGGGFERGDDVIVTGMLDDRFRQRTLRAGVGGVASHSVDVEPATPTVATGSVGEPREGSLIRAAGRIRAAATQLSAGLAFDIDDGTGPLRVIVGPAAEIDTDTWTPGATVELVGVVGQRDSSGAGTAGYRLLPRSPSDVVSVSPPATPSPSASPPPSPAPSTSAPPTSMGAISIAAARERAPGADVRVRGTVTLPPGIVASDVAAIEDDSGAILLRTPSGTSLATGQLVDVEGERSTRSGMETIRLSAPAAAVDAAVRPPVPSGVRTGDVGEGVEARLVRVVGVLVASARRAATATVTFDVDDGSGPVRVVAPAPIALDDGPLVAGARVDVVGVVGQETTSAAPAAGYRLWPRAAGDVVVLAPPVTSQSPPTGGARSPGGGAGAEGPTRDGGPAGSRDLDVVDDAGLRDVRIGATLVRGAWPELGIGGLLWDGARLVALSSDSVAAVDPVAARRVPVAVELTGLRAIGVDPETGLPVVSLSLASGTVTARSTAPVPAATALPPPAGAPRWVTLVGTVAEDAGLVLVIDGGSLELDVRCAAGAARLIAGSRVEVTGIGFADPPRVVVPCDAVRAAPTLGSAGRPTARDVRAADSAPQSPGPAAAPSPSGTDGRRALAAVLLVAGLLSAVGGIAAFRRFTAGPAPDARGTDGAAAEPPAMPAVRLVGLRRDRGP